MNKGIKDDIFYWSQFNKVLNLYCQLKKICSRNWKASTSAAASRSNTPRVRLRLRLHRERDRGQHQERLQKKNKVPVPDIYTEFGSFTVGESGAVIYSVLGEKQQNDREGLVHDR